MTPRDHDLVYSSDRGRMCPECGRPQQDCTCRQTGRPASAPSPAAAGPVRIARQTKGRKGKTVTVITGLPLDGLELADLAKDLKRQYVAAAGRSRTASSRSRAITGTGSAIS